MHDSVCIFACVRASDEQDKLINGLADRHQVRDYNHARQMLSGIDALISKTGHGLHVVSCQNATFRRRPRQQLRIGSFAEPGLLNRKQIGVRQYESDAFNDSGVEVFVEEESEHCLNRNSVLAAVFFCSLHGLPARLQLFA